jgi:hypothetical protein
MRELPGHSTGPRHAALLRSIAPQRHQIRAEHASDDKIAFMTAMRSA